MTSSKSCSSCARRWLHLEVVEALGEAVDEHAVHAGDQQRRRRRVGCAREAEGALGQAVELGLPVRAVAAGRAARGLEIDLELGEQPARGLGSGNSTSATPRGRLGEEMSSPSARRARERAISSSTRIASASPARPWTRSSRWSRPADPGLARDWRWVTAARRGPASGRSRPGSPAALGALLGAPAVVGAVVMRQPPGLGRVGDQLAGLPLRRGQDRSSITRSR